MNIQKLTLQELRALQNAVHVELQRREKEELAAARAHILAIATKCGIPLTDLFAKPPKREALIRYRHPSDGTRQWSGRGRQPQWIKDWLAKGKPIESLRVSK